MSKLLGGWSMYLSRYPFNEFDVIMYGMVTNLTGLTTGTLSNPSWSPEVESKPTSNSSCFKGKRLWTYGGGGCSPEGKPASTADVARIISATINKSWDGIDFDDECNINTPLVIEAMQQLRQNDKETSFGFTAGYSYNHPNTADGQKLKEKVKRIITCGYCDRLIHYCYGATSWNQSDILNNVRQSLERSLDHGMCKDKTILSLTTKGLTDWNLNYFIDQILDLDIGGLFMWRYDEVSPAHLQIIKNRLGK